MITDEQKWLLKYGRGWVPWFELLDGPVGEQEIDPIHERLLAAGKVKLDKKKMRVKLELKEKNES